MNRVSIVVSFVALFLLSACQTTSFKSVNQLEGRSEKVRFVLMPTDIQLSEMVASGRNEPNALWTKQGEEHFGTALRAFLNEKGFQFNDVLGSKKLRDLPADEAQIVKLYGQVGTSIMLHKYVPQLALPNKGERFDWSLGDEAKTLGEKYGADYGLFIYVRDSYSSGGRVAFIIVSSVLFGVAPPGGQQIGYASLVDLRTGDIVWFNRLARGAGDMRNAEDARETVKLLLADLPK